MVGRVVRGTGVVMGRKLHIGGLEKTDGWEVINAVAGPAVDHVGNAGDLSRFSDGAFDEVYASHVLEHFDYQRDLIPALQEWRRVLAPSGRLLLSVPDLDILAKMVIAKERLSLGERIEVMQMIFGAHSDQYDFHQVGLNQDFLFYFLNRAGFRSAERVADLGCFEDTSRYRFKGVPISLNVIAYK